jgi:hypothetical protein
MAVIGYPRFGYGYLVPIATITSSSEETGYPDDNAADENLHTYWKPNATGWQALKFYWATAIAPTFLGVLGHTLFSSGVTETQLKYGTADNGTDFENVLVSWDVDGETSDYDKFLVLTSPPTKHYWLLTSNVVSTHPRIAVVFLGYVTTSCMLSRPDKRLTDYGTAIEETAGGYIHAENFADSRDSIFLHAEGITDAERAMWETIESYHKNGLHPLCFLDMDTDSASGLCTYGRIFAPLGYSSPAPDANDIEERLFKQEL